MIICQCCVHSLFLLLPSGQKICYCRFNVIFHHLHTLCQLQVLTSYKAKANELIICYQLATQMTHWICFCNKEQLAGRDKHCWPWCCVCWAVIPGVSRGAVFSVPGLPVAATSCLFPLWRPTQRRGFFLLDEADFHELYENLLSVLLWPPVLFKKNVFWNDFINLKA